MTFHLFATLLQIAGILISFTGFAGFLRGAWRRAPGRALRPYNGMFAWGNALICVADLVLHTFLYAGIAFAATAMGAYAWWLAGGRDRNLRRLRTVRTKVRRTPAADHLPERTPR